MIRGNREQKIKEYLYIDHMAEGFEFIKPGEGEELIGIPYGWCNDCSMPFIEHRKDGKTLKTVNCTDVSIIIFDV